TYAPPGSTFVLQPGIYQVQLILPLVGMGFNTPTGGAQTLGVNVLVNGNVVDSTFGGAQLVNNGTTFSVIGDTLLQISAANTVVGFNVFFQSNNPPSVGLFGCRVVFTRL